MANCMLFTVPIRTRAKQNGQVMTNATDGVVISQAERMTFENIRIESTKGKNLLNIKNARNVNVDGKTY